MSGQITSKQDKETPFQIACAIICVTAIITAVAFAILLCLGATALGPILWGVAPSAGALLAGKILTFITIGNIGIALITTVLGSSCCSSLRACFDNN